MAQLHPDLSSSAGSPGQYREREMLRMLADRLPEAFRIYHGLLWSSLHDGVQRFGELDAVVLSPGGHLAVLEVKSGEVDLSALGVFKQYGAVRKDVVKQVHAQLHGLIGRLRDEGLSAAKVSHFLLLPDYRVSQGSLNYPRERIIDADELDTMAQRLLDATSHAPISQAATEQLRAFLGNRFAVAIDPACLLTQRHAATRQLAAGLATWVPRVSSPSNCYVVEATAGSGKTQLALQLLQGAASARQRARYVCFNRPLADHIRGLAPATVDVSTVHEFAMDLLRRTGVTPDFSNLATFGQSIDALVSQSDQAVGTLDLLIVDESQDFAPEWVQALSARLRPDGRLYVLGDAQQAIYDKPAFALGDATEITCADNFRSPRRVVQAINALGLTETPVEAKGPDPGDAPGLHAHGADDPGGLRCAAQLVDQALQKGYRLEDIVVLSFRGREQSGLLRLDHLGAHPLRRFTGKYDSAGNTCWTTGSLTAESVYRFKGQAAPVVIVCEIDFEALDAKTCSKLFVAMTRAQTAVHLVLSGAAEKALTERLLAEH